jgi:hypothetical protein
MDMRIKSLLLFSAILLCGLCVRLDAQVSSTLHQSGPADKTLQAKNWVSSSLAIQIAQTESAQLGTQLQQLQQSGASAQEIGKVATRKEFYDALLVALQYGKPVAQAFADAWSFIGGGTDAASDHPFFSAVDFDNLYQSALAKLSN